MFVGRSVPFLCVVRLSSVARSCATRDASNKYNVCKPTIPAGINRPPPSETISHVTRVPDKKTPYLNLFLQLSLFWGTQSKKRRSWRNPVCRNLLSTTHESAGQCNIIFSSRLLEGWREFACRDDLHNIYIAVSCSLCVVGAQHIALD